MLPDRRGRGSDKTHRPPGVARTRRRPASLEDKPRSRPRAVQVEWKRRRPAGQRPTGDAPARGRSGRRARRPRPDRARGLAAQARAAGKRLQRRDALDRLEEVLRVELRSAVDDLVLRRSREHEGADGMTQVVRVAAEHPPWSLDHTTGSGDLDVGASVHVLHGKMRVVDAVASHSTETATTSRSTTPRRVSSVTQVFGRTPHAGVCGKSSRQAPIETQGSGRALSPCCHVRNVP